MIKFTIPLNPVTKKNSNVCTKSGVVLASKAYRRYEHDALKIIPPQARVHIAGKVNVKALYYTKINYEEAKSRIDLNNLHNALMDTLVAAGVLADDNSRIVCSTDGSQVLHDRMNPRTDVEITAIDDKKAAKSAESASLREDMRALTSQFNRALDLLREAEGCWGCKYAIDGEPCSCSDCSDEELVNCNEACPWWGDPCEQCNSKDGWTWEGDDNEL